MALGMILGVSAFRPIGVSAETFTLSGGLMTEVDIVATDPNGLLVELVQGSTLKGDISSSGFGTGITIEDGASWDGNANFKNGSVSVSLYNEGNWDGDMTLQTDVGQSSNSYVSISQAQWQGDIIADNKGEAAINLTVGGGGTEIWIGDASSKNGELRFSMDGGKWTGDMDLTQNDSTVKTSVDVYAMRPGAVWNGNAYVQDGASFTGRFYSGSVWNGSVEIKNETGVNLNSGANSMEISSEGTIWTGDFSFDNTSSSQVATTNTISSYYGAVWNGDFQSSNSVDAESLTKNSIVISDEAQWNGSATVSGNQEVEILVNRGRWNGNLDLTGNHTASDSAGHLRVFEGSWHGSLNGSDQSLEVKIENNSEWEITGNSFLDLLNVEGNSKLTFVDSTARGGEPFHAVTVKGDFRADAGTEINMRTDLANLRGYLLNIQGDVYGQSVVAVNNQGSASVDPSKELMIIHTGSSDGNAFALSHEVEVGGFKYLMKQEGTDWVLYSMDRLPATSPTLTNTASGAINTLSAGYLLNYAENESMLKRTGELRGGSADRNVWGRVYGGEFSSAATGYVGAYDMDYQGVQIGADKKIVLKQNKGDLYLGVMGGYSKGSLNYTNGSGSVDSKTIGIYGTYAAPSDFYSNLILKYGWTNSDFSVRDSAGEGVTGKGLKSDGFSSSLEVGKKIHFNKDTKSGWYVEPQAQITYGAQNGGSVTASNGLTVDLDGYNSLQGRLGMRAGYEIKSGENPVNIYGKLSYLHEFDGKMDMALNGINIQEDLSDSWWNYGVGVTARVGDRHNVYLEVEKSSGDRFNQKWGISGGYRVAW